MHEGEFAKWNSVALEELPNIGRWHGNAAMVLDFRPFIFPHFPFRDF
jgi:hypothetical protein